MCWNEFPCAWLETTAMCYSSANSSTYRLSCLGSSGRWTNTNELGASDKLLAYSLTKNIQWGQYGYEGLFYSLSGLNGYFREEEEIHRSILLNKASVLTKRTIKSIKHKMGFLAKQYYKMLLHHIQSHIKSKHVVRLVILSFWRPDKAINLFIPEHLLFPRLQGSKFRNKKRNHWKKIFLTNNLPWRHP